MPNDNEQKPENLRKVFEQHWLHGRHVENERLWFTNVYAILWGGSLAFMSQQGISTALAIFLLVLSYLGLLVCHSLRLAFIEHTRLAEIILRQEWQLTDYSVFYRRPQQVDQAAYPSGEARKTVSVHHVFYGVYVVGVVASSVMIFQIIPWVWLGILIGLFSIIGSVALLCWFDEVEDSLYKEIGKLDRNNSNGPGGERNG